MDLYVLERAFTSAHPDVPDMVCLRGAAGRVFALSCCGPAGSPCAQCDKVLGAYKDASRQWSSTMNKFADGGGPAWAAPPAAQRPRLTGGLPAVRMRGRKRVMVG